MPLKLSLLLAVFYVVVPDSIAFSNNDIKYPVNEIPKQLLVDAHAVYRIKNSHFIIEDINRATYKEHQVITILNKTGNGHAYIVAFYDKLRKVSKFTANVYDSKGGLIKRLKKSDIVDESSIDDGSLFDDSRVMSADLREDHYPYTIEIEKEISYKYLYSIPDWIALDGEDDAVQHSEYKITTPLELQPRFKQINFVSKPVIIKKNEVIEYLWQLEDLSAVKFEPYSNGYLDVSPILRVSPNKFKFENYEGSMESWDDIAKWQNILNDNRDDLSEERKEEIRKLVKGLETDEEKIRAIYQYMQSKTRYVSLQLGIGGFQPFKTSVVDELGYGDCKALSFYTQSLLKAADIEAYYTWVYGGDNPPEVDKKFPIDNFNHIILCVPTKQDTVWLECTSQTTPAGYLGEFTGDRDVLVITNDGGKIVRTPAYEHTKNAVSTSANVIIDENGSADMQAQIKFIGQGTEYKNLNYFIKLNNAKKERWIDNYLQIENYKVFDYNFIESPDLIPETTLSLNLGANNLASVSNKRLFIEPNLLNKNTFVPKKIYERKSPIYLRFSKQFSDEIVFTLPANYDLEYIPENKILDSPFGSLSVSFHVEASGNITYTRLFQINKGVFSKDKYPEFLDFFKKAAKIDKMKIVMVKRE